MNDHKEVLHIKEFHLTGVGQCEIQIFSGEDISTPMAHIVDLEKSNEVCCVRLDEPVYDSDLNYSQLIEIDSAMRSKRTVHCTNMEVETWGDICACWKDLNDKDDVLTLPIVPPYYTKILN